MMQAIIQSFITDKCTLAGIQGNHNFALEKNYDINDNNMFINENLNTTDIGSNSIIISQITTT